MIPIEKLQPRLRLAGITHAFSNPGEQPARFLNFNTRAGWEGYMRELSQAAARGPLTAAAIGAVASRYDFEIV